MSFAKALQEAVAQAIEVQLKPLRRTLAGLQSQVAQLEALGTHADRLALLAAALQSSASRGASKRGAHGKRRKAVAAKAAAPARRQGRSALAGGSARACAIIGCKRPNRSKGYCSAHYQKRSLLQRTGRLPAEWVELAAPQSVADVALKRGRKPAQTSPEKQPKPKAWVRKAANGALVELAPAEAASPAADVLA